MSEDPKDEIIISPMEDPVGNNIIFEPPILVPHPMDEDDGGFITLADISSNSIDQGPLGSPIGFADQINIQSISQQQTKIIQPNPFHQMPQAIKSPAANYYCLIKWDGLISQWNLVRFSTPMDGNCLFHAISNSFFEPYHTEQMNGKHVSRTQMVSFLRKELAEKLATKISEEPDSHTHYDTLNGGNTSAFAEAVPEFKLSYMQSQLNSSFPIGYGYMEFIGNALNKDIYILEALRRDIYVTDELSLTIKGNRRSIVLYYMNGHYELVGIHNPDGTFDTHFSPDHSLIRFLYNRVQQIIS